MRKLWMAILFTSSIASASEGWMARGLTKPVVERWSLQNNKVLVVVFFKPDCIPCREQIEQIRCLANEPVDVKLIGTFSSEKELKSEYLKMKTTWPAYYGDPELLKSFNIEAEATPQTLVINEKARHHRVGVWACEDLRSKIKEMLL